eukprot:2633676-Rhodomonas_salina.1
MARNSEQFLPLGVRRGNAFRVSPRPKFSQIRKCRLRKVILRTRASVARLLPNTAQQIQIRATSVSSAVSSYGQFPRRNWMLLQKLSRTKIGSYGPYKEIVLCQPYWYHWYKRYRDA